MSQSHGGVHSALNKILGVVQTVLIGAILGLVCAAYVMHK